MFSTGLNSIDKIIGGIEPGELMIVSGSPCAGKTALCLSAAINAEKKILFLTGVKREHLTGRLKMFLLRERWEKIGSGVNLLAGLQLYFHDPEGIGIEEENEAMPSELEKLIEEFAVCEPKEETKDMDPLEMYTRQLPPWLLVVDPVDYVFKYYPRQEDGGALRRELLQKYIKKIKLLAKKFNAAVIITAGALQNGDKAELSSEVASCAPLAEVICLLDWQDREDLTTRSLEIVKNVKGSSGMASLLMDRKAGMFREYPVQEGGK